MRDPRTDRQTASNSEALARYRRVREASTRLAAPLSAEDCQAQSMPDASPVKWHLAHTAWFFETFVLAPHLPGYRLFDPDFRMLFNSYYVGVGDRPARAERGLVTRPGLERVLAYRAQVDAGMEALLADPPPAVHALLQLGLAHEEQHQELILTDLKHLLSRSPLRPAYAGRWPLVTVAPVPRDWVAVAGGLHDIGHAGEGFAFDNEGPRHRVWLEPFELATHPVTNADWIGFIEDGGYRRPDLWLSAGWDAAQAGGWEAPLYWRADGDGWRCFTLHGDGPVDPHAPVCHVSFYEADAFARWASARLPTEAEWEVAAEGYPVTGNFADNGVFHPLAPTAPATGLAHLFGDVWEWTRSAYEPYPGFRAAEGAVGEYNGKFMSGQQVLRGGSALTPPGHVRATYRNFFPPDARWQMSGLRLARDRPDGAVRPAARPARAPRLVDAGVPATDVAAGLAAGLMADPPRIASGHFYDALGSKLFEAITELPEYGLTRAEAGLFDAHAVSIAAEARKRLGGDFQLIDLGAGSAAKAESLIPFFAPSRYIAVDIATGFLAQSLARVQAAHPALEMIGIGMDFADSFHLPADLADRPTLFFYPGSSIGNFEPAAAARFLTSLKAAAPRSALLLGADLVKERALLEAAYDDSAGVTAAFNRNILRHANRLLGSDFDLRHWRHVARYNGAAARIEMWLESTADQQVRWPGGGRDFAAGSRILTEISTKWTEAELTGLLAEAGFGEPRLWTDGGFALALGG